MGQECCTQRKPQQEEEPPIQRITTSKLLQQLQAPPSPTSTPKQTKLRVNSVHEFTQLIPDNRESIKTPQLLSRRNSVSHESPTKITKKELNQLSFSMNFDSTTQSSIEQRLKEGIRPGKLNREFLKRLECQITKGSTETTTSSQNDQFDILFNRPIVTNRRPRKQVVSLQL